jgi:deferrochelatase/peroxidase EfeB
MGLGDDAMATFAPAFREGMRQIDRQRRLGDETPAKGTNESVIAGGPVWSGNAKDPYHIANERVAQPTKDTVHAALLLYHQGSEGLAALVALAEAALAPFGVTTVRSIDLLLDLDANGLNHEHFGFADGVSQPIPFGDPIAPRRRDIWHDVPAGDVLMGHLDSDGDAAPGPLVSDRAKGAAALPAGPAGFRDLGLDGAYLVIRELSQDVPAFWTSMRAAAEGLGRDDKWVAARVVGRELNGDPLVPGGVLPPHHGEPANEFGFRRGDPVGLGCPMGAHMRRANPRDGLAPKLSDAKLFLAASNHHRILRRGRRFGPPFVENEPPGVERGLLFMAVNTDITRQFEFIQQTWVFNRGFAALFDETDPLVGPAGRLTIPERPLCARVGVQTFVQLVGGDYFFLPSLPALSFLAQLT